MRLLSDERKYTVCGWIDEVFPDPLNKEILTVLKIEREDAIFWDNEGYINRNYENIHPGCVGTLVDLFTRYIITGDFNESFDPIVRGISGMEKYLAEPLKKWYDPELKKIRGIKYRREIYENALAKDKIKLNEVKAHMLVHGLDNEAIKKITELVRFNNFFRAGFKAFEKKVEIPTVWTIQNLHRMAIRSAKFLESFEGLRCGLYFWSNAFLNGSKTLCAGDGDYWTKDTILDMKCQGILGVHANDIKQTIIYYILSQHDLPCYKFKHCILFNPRWGAYFKFNFADIPDRFLNFFRENI